MVPPFAVEGVTNNEMYALRSEIARSSDPILDAGAHDVRRVHIAVDVGFDHPVHGEATKSTNDLGMIADLLRAQNDPPSIRVDVLPAALTIAASLSEKAVADADTNVPDCSICNMPS